MVNALQPVLEALRLCEMHLPTDAQAATASASLLLRGGQIAIPAPKPSVKRAGPSASKLRFRRLARKATQNRAEMATAKAESPEVKKKVKTIPRLQEATTLPRWIVLTELHLLLASSAHAAGMWALRNYATVASLRLLEARGQTVSAGGDVARMGTHELSNVGFGSPDGGYSMQIGEGRPYGSDAETALAARVYSAVAASARQLGVPEWAEEQHRLAQQALGELAERTEATVSRIALS